MNQSNINITNIINLEDYRATFKDGTFTKVKVFADGKRGDEIRKASKIDEIEKIFEEVTIIIPDNIYSISPSFFEELFVNVVLKLGREKFIEKFKFQSIGEFNFERPLSEAISRILRTKTNVHKLKDGISIEIDRELKMVSSKVKQKLNDAILLKIDQELGLCEILNTKVDDEFVDKLVKEWTNAMRKMFNVEQIEK